MYFLHFHIYFFFAIVSEYIFTQRMKITEELTRKNKSFKKPCAIINYHNVGVSKKFIPLTQLYFYNEF